MNILVTGGLGFIGRHVTKYLLEKDHKITIIDNLSKSSESVLENLKSNNIDFIKADLLDSKTSKEILKDNDICYHFAARIGGIGYFHKYPATILRDNSIMTLNLWDAARDSKTKMVYVSSSMVFESSTVFPSKEEYIKTSPPPFSSYGFSKLVGEYICKAYNEEFGVPYLIVRPFNAYGPGEVPEEVGYAHVIPDIIKKIMSGQYPLEILGSGEQIRCYTYVTDLAKGIALAAENSVNDDFNVGSDKETTVKELAEILWKLCEKKDKIEFKSVHPFRDDVKRRVPDISKLKALGWKPEVSLEEGLKLTLDWIKQNAL